MPWQITARSSAVFIRMTQLVILLLAVVCLGLVQFVHRPCNFSTKTNDSRFGAVTAVAIASNIKRTFGRIKFSFHSHLNGIDVGCVSHLVKQFHSK